VDVLLGFAVVVVAVGVETVRPVLPYHYLPSQSPLRHPHIINIKLVFFNYYIIFIFGPVTAIVIFFKNKLFFLF